MAYLDAIAESVADELRKTAKEIKAARGVAGAVALVPVVIARVEKLGKELNLSGADKKECAIAIICKLVPDRVIPDWALAWVLGWAIEKALPALRAKLLGKR